NSCCYIYRSSRQYRRDYFIISKYFMDRTFLQNEKSFRKLHTYSTYLSFTLISRKLFNATKIVAPISERIAIQRVSQPGITNSKAIILIPMANVMFALMIFSVFLLSLTANGSLLKSSPINALSAVS